MGGTGDRDEPLTYVWCSRDADLPGYPPENDRLREGLVRTDNPFAVRHAIESALFGYGDPPWWLSAGLTEQLVGFSGFHQAPLRPEPAGTHGRFLLQPVSAEAGVLAHDVAESRREAAAFVGWLMKRWGEVPLRELFKTARAVEHGALAEPHPAEDADFAAVYGISLSEALDLWQDEVGDVDIERRRLNTLACATSIPVPLDENSEARVASRFERLSDPAPPFEYWRPGLNEGHAFVVSQDSTLTVEVEAARRTRISIEGCFAPLQDGDVGAILEPVGTGGSGTARLTAEVQPGTWIVRVGQYAAGQVDELPAYSLHVRIDARSEDPP